MFQGTRNQNPNVTSKASKQWIHLYCEVLCSPETLGTADGEGKIGYCQLLPRVLAPESSIFSYHQNIVLLIKL